MIGGPAGSSDRGGVLVGRGAERAVLTGLLDQARAGRGGCVVLAGGPGAGKTALLDELAAQVGPPTWTVLGASCRHGELTEPLAPLIRALGPAVVGVAPTGSRGLLEAGAPADPARAVEGRVLDVVDEFAARGPTLLVVDDVHWADAATVRCLRRLVDRAPHSSLALVMAQRTPAAAFLAPGVADHPGWDRAGGVLLLELAPLTAPDAAELCRRRLGAPPGPRLAALLAEAEGNPLLLLAVLDAVRDEVAPDAGGVELVSGRWVHPGTVIARQVERLDPADRRVLQVAAVAGPQATVALLADAVARPVVEVIDALERAVAAGVIRAGPDRYRFRHDLYREAVLAGLPADARRALHLAMARLLADRSGDELAVAEHYLLGATPGDRAAIDWLHGTAHRLCRRMPGTALRLVEAALALEPEPSRALLQTKFEALSGCGRATEAETLGRTLLAQTTDPVDRARLHRDLALAQFVKGRPALAAEEMSAASALLVGRPGWARTVAEQAFTALLALDLPAAAGLARQALGPGTEADAVVAAEAVLTMCSLFAADLDEAHRHAGTMVRVADATWSGEAHQYQPWFCAGLLAAECDESDRLQALVATGRRVAVRTGSAWAVPAYDGLAAFGALRSGHLADAAALAEAALTYSDETDSFGIIVWCHAFLGQIRRAQGDGSAARHHTEQAGAILATGRTGLGLDHVAMCRSLLAEDAGDLAGAAGHLEAIWNAFGQLSLLLPRQWIAPRLARLAVRIGERGLAEEVAAAAAQTARRAPLATTRADAAVAAAWSSEDPSPALEAVEFLTGSPRRAQRAEALHAAAVLVGRRGHAAEARALGAAAAELFDAVGAPALAQASRQAVGARRRTSRPVRGVEALTRSERAVAQLVAEGLGNDAIAERLSLSRRTVESHVSAAYRKLGVSTRVELAITVREAAPPR